MRIFIDTNVLISAFVFGGTSGILMEKLLMSSHELLVSEYIDEEFKQKLFQKWPKKAEFAYDLYRTLPIHLCRSSSQMEGVLRDPKDIPVLSDALYNGADVILTGDKDFLEAQLEKPLVLSPTLLLDFLNSKI